jgi:HEAT repeat protein
MEYLREKILSVQLDPAARNELANALAASLDDAASTHPYKVFVCRQLYLIGGEDQIDELAPLLHDPKLTHAARYALEVIPGVEVNDLLWEGIAGADGPVAAGLAASLAARGGASTVIRLGELLTHPHRDVVASALVGLGRLGGVEAERVVRRSFPNLAEELHTEYYEALLACAGHYETLGMPAEAGRVFEELMVPALPLSVRLAAFHGLVALRGEGASPLIAQALISGDAPWVAAALAGVRTSGGPDSTLLFARQLVAVPPDVQAMLIQALADRGDTTALPAISAGLQSTETTVQQAAVEALGVLGNETSVEALLSGLMGVDEAVAKACRRSLARIPDAGVNGALIQAYERGDAVLRTAVAPLLAERQASEALPALFAMAESQEGEARSSAFKAIGQIGRDKDLDQLRDLYYEVEAEEARDAAAQAITALCRRVAPSGDRATARAALYTLAPTSLTRAGSLAIFRELGDDMLLPLVISACGDPDSIVKDAGIIALSGWPNATPLQEVYALAKSEETESQRRTALDGYIRLLGLTSDRPVEERVAGYKAALALAGEVPEITRSVLAGLSGVKSTEALDLAEHYLPDTELHHEAAIAAEKIRSAFYAVTASVKGETVGNVVDGKIDTLWETGTPQVAGQWIEIDMSRPASIKGIVLDASRTKGAYPREYSVQVYAKGSEPGVPIVTGAGAEGVTEIVFPSALTGQVVRVTQMGSDPASPWAIHELRIIPE